MLAFSFCLLAFQLLCVRSAPNGVRMDQRQPGHILPLPPEAESPSNGPLVGRAAPSSSTSLASNTTLILPAPPATTSTAPPSPVPTPLDYSISYSLSTPCLTFLTSTLSTPDFVSCLPFSLLLTTSTSYASLLSAAKTSGNYAGLNSLLAYLASPQPSSSECDPYMAGVYQAISDKRNCGADINGSPHMPVAVEAWSGIGNYQVMREAAGLTDPQTGRYCYLEAVASSSPDDLYLWSLQAGIPLPSTSTPTCSKCSALLLAHYADSLSENNALNATVVGQAIQTVNQACGSALVSYSASAKSPTSAAWRSPSAMNLVSIFVLGALTFVLS